MIVDSIKKIVESKNISELEAYSSMAEIMNGCVAEPLIAAYLVALRMKGESVDEITGSVKAMRDSGVRINCGAKVVVDTCGTGGDTQNSFNVSTAAAIIVSAAGYTVAKHGNRAVSSLCGSADLLAELGIAIDAEPDVICRNLQENKFAFLFAPKMHPAMKYAMPVRKTLGIRTIFNVLGPMANPAGANVQLIGVFSEELVDKIAQVLPRVGIKYGMVVHGSDYDEITLTGETVVAEIENSSIKKYKILPEEFGFKTVKKSELAGGNAAVNKQIMIGIFEGKRSGYRDMAVLNAGACIMLAKKAESLPAELKDSIKTAEEIIDSGKALEKLKNLQAKH